MLKLFKKLFFRTPLSKKVSTKKSLAIPIGFGGIINFILEADKNKQIILGKRNDQIFISFLAPEVKPFFSDWFAICRLHSKGEISEDTYLSCIESIKANYSIDGVDIKSENQIDTEAEEWDNDYLYNDDQAHEEELQEEIYTE